MGVVRDTSFQAMISMEDIHKYEMVVIIGTHTITHNLNYFGSKLKKKKSFVFKYFQIIALNPTFPYKPFQVLYSYLFMNFIYLKYFYKLWSRSFSIEFPDIYFWQIQTRTAGYLRQQGSWGCDWWMWIPNSILNGSRVWNMGMFSPLFGWR